MAHGRGWRRCLTEIRLIQSLERYLRAHLTLFVLCRLEAPRCSRPSRHLWEHLTLLVLWRLRFGALEHLSPQLDPLSPCHIGLVALNIQFEP
jgi:hypothetical protein